MRPFFTTCVVVAGVALGGHFNSLLNGHSGKTAAPRPRDLVREDGQWKFKRRILGERPATVPAQ